jgi:hypothetical protein
MTRLSSIHFNPESETRLDIFAPHPPLPHTTYDHRGRKHEHCKSFCSTSFPLTLLFLTPHMITAAPLVQLGACHLHQRHGSHQRHRLSLRLAPGPVSLHTSSPRPPRSAASWSSSRSASRPKASTRPSRWS